MRARDQRQLPSPDEAMPDRTEPPFSVPERHAVLGTRLQPPFPDGLAVAVFGMGCFWGAERIFWRTPGVWSTMAGYAGGYTANPTFEEVCTDRTGHAEIVQVVFSAQRVSYDELLRVFWEAHDPTQGMRQGHDAGPQYRSTILCREGWQFAAAQATRRVYQRALSRAGYGGITTQIAPLHALYPAEDYHQQYLQKVPDGYSGLGGTGVRYPVGR